jgi:hypothetical protein
MEEFIQQLTEILKEEFPGSNPELKHASPLQKVGGYLIWNGFDGMEQIDRQRRLGAAIRKRLSISEQVKITTILTLTPEEAELMQAQS